MRVRIRYSKQGKVRFLGHRDVARIWERVWRRAGVPVAYTEGFSPRPKMAFGLALSTGYESDCEYIDVEIDDAQLADYPVDMNTLPERLSLALPPGMEVQVANPLARGGESLQQAVTSCNWLIETTGVSRDQLEEAVAQALAADEIMVTRERKGKQVRDDLRPAVFDLAVSDDHILTAELGTQPRSLRPSELLAALEPSPEVRKVRRTHQWITVDGERCEPIPVAPPSTAPAEARAS